MCVSMQVLQEFYVNLYSASKKSASQPADFQIISDFSLWKVYRPGGG